MNVRYYLGNGGNDFEATLWEQAAAQGITVVVSAGDSGSAGCDDPDLPAPYDIATFGLAVNGIASTPFNVAAGGTDFDITAASYQSTYWSANDITDASGLNAVSATRYIPETTWNDSCAQNLGTGSISGSGGCTAENYSGGGIVAGGGGQSNAIPYDSAGDCCSFYGKPSWQTLPESGAGLTGLAGLDPDFTRDLPDISLFAADGYVSDSFYVVCESDLNSPPAARPSAPALASATCRWRRAGISDNCRMNSGISYLDKPHTSRCSENRLRVRSPQAAARSTAKQTRSPSRASPTGNAAALRYASCRSARRLDTGGMDVAAAYDHILLAAGDTEITALVDPAEIAGHEPALRIERIFGRLLGRRNSRRHRLAPRPPISPISPGAA